MSQDRSKHERRNQLPRGSRHEVLQQTTEDGCFIERREFHAMGAASAEVYGIVGLCGDMGMVGGEIYADSPATLGISNRTGWQAQAL